MFGGGGGFGVFLFVWNFEGWFVCGFVGFALFAVTCWF